VVPLTFDDVPFEVERSEGACCHRCGAGVGADAESYLVELPGVAGSRWVCSDTDWCNRRLEDRTGTDTDTATQEGTA
jgi:alpha-D-ribose 1-methylphosphonate 5-phosphate C-P lyase